MKVRIGLAVLVLCAVLVGATALNRTAPAEEPHGGAPAEQQHEATPAAEAAHDTPGHEAPGAAPAEHPDAAHEAAPGAHHEAAGHGAEKKPISEAAFEAAENASFIDLILKALGYHKPHGGTQDPKHPTLSLIAMFQMPILCAIVIFILGALAVAGTRRREMIPGPLQNLVETAIGGLDDFVQGVLGFDGRHFVPFIGTLFLYIWFMNLMGILPFFKSPTSSYNTTVALAICVFLYVQWTGLRRNGIGGYLYHLAGEPRDVIGWSLSPLMFPLHMIGELAKPLSLSLRLFGNIFGEETLIAVFVGLGVAVLAFTHLPVGLPLHVPFMFLALLTSTIQALVFTLLSTIYFGLMLPHHEHHEEHAAGGGHH